MQYACAGVNMYQDFQKARDRDNKAYERITEEMVAWTVHQETQGQTEAARLKQLDQAKQAGLQKTPKAWKDARQQHKETPSSD